MANVLISVGNHGTASIPSTLSDHDYFRSKKGICGAHHRADVQVVTPILDRDGEFVAPGVEIGDDRLDRPVSVLIDDVTAVALAQQIVVVARILRPRLRMRADSDEIV